MIFRFYGKIDRVFNMKKLSNILKIIFVITSLLTVYEFMFIGGMFTAPLMTFVMFVVGLTNAIVALIQKKYFEVYLYLIATIGLIMGNAKDLFYL